MNYESYFGKEDVRPVAVRCDSEFLYVTLADERTISAPLWWYPILLQADLKDRNEVELMLQGIWWPIMDEGISVKSMLLGWKMPRAINGIGATV